MGLFADKNKTPEKQAKGLTPYQIGLNGTVGDLYQAEKAAKADLEAKKTAYEDNDKKLEGPTGLFRNIDKNISLREAYYEAEEAPYKIHSEFYRGAFQAFMEGRPENLQEILSRPEAFPRSSYDPADRLALETLVALLIKVPDPGIPGLALAKVAEDKRQNLLDSALYQFVDRYTNTESVVSALLDAGANAACESSIILAAAIHKNAPAAVVDMLLENGAIYDDALKTMQKNPGYYGDTTLKLELFQCRQKIKQLEETIKELTGQTDKQKPAQPAAKEKAADSGKTKTLRTSNLLAKLPKLM